MTLKEHMEQYTLKSDLIFKAENISEAREILEMWFKHMTDRKLSDLKQRIMEESKVSGYAELIQIDTSPIAVSQFRGTIDE